MVKTVCNVDGAARDGGDSIGSIGGVSDGICGVALRHLSTVGSSGKASVR